MEAGGRNWRLMRDRNALSALAVVAIFVLVFLIAVGAGRSAGPLGASEGIPGGALTLNTLYLGLLTLAFVGACLIAYASLIGAGRRRRKDDTPERVNVLPVPWWGHVLAGLFLLALVTAVVLVFVFLRNGESQVVPMPGELPPSVSPGDGARPTEDIPVVPLQWWLLGVVGAALLGGLVLLLLRRRRGAAGVLWSTEASPRRQALRDVVEASLDDLEQEPDSRRAVIRAYAGMERALAEHGLGRRPHEAPVEYLVRWLGSLGVGHSAGERLTDLYQQARFSTHVVDADMKSAAIGALVALRDELTGDDS